MMQKLYRISFEWFKSELTRPVLWFFLYINLVKNNIILKALLLCFIISLPILLYGQNTEIKFRNPLLPLSDNSVESIIEDYKGFMWFATQSGLNRYDGVNMTVYGKVFGDSTSLSSNKVLSLYETKNNELWVGTSSGLNLYNRDENNFTQYYFDKSAKNSPDFNLITEIVEDADGDLWLATQGGTCILDRKNKEFVQFRKFTDSEQHFEDRYVNTIVVDKNGRIFAGTDDSKILEYDKKAGIIKEHHFDNGATKLSSVKEIRQLTVSNNGWIWASTVGSGLFKMKRIENGHIWFDQYLHNPKNSNSLSHNFVNELCEFRKGEILIGTINGGLNKYNYNSNTFEVFQKSSANENTIGGNSIWSLYKDKKNRVWIGIFNVGVNVIDSIASKFTSYKK